MSPRSRRTWTLTVWVADKELRESELEAAAGRAPSGSGAGTGAWDVSFSFTTQAAARRAEARIAGSFGGRAVYVQVEPTPFVEAPACLAVWLPLVRGTHYDRRLEEQIGRPRDGQCVVERERGQLWNFATEAEARQIMKRVKSLRIPRLRSVITTYDPASPH